MNTKDEKKSVIYRGLFEKYALFIVFIVIIATFYIMTPKFLTISNITNLFVQATPLGIAAIGMALVLIQGGIDLSAGSIMYLVIVLCSKLFNVGLGLVPFIAISIIAGAMLGAINGILISRLNVIPFIATLGAMALFRGIGLTLSDQRTILFTDDVVSIIVNTKIIGIPIVVVAFALILILAQFVFSYTQFGRQLYAIGNNEGVAIKIGIKVKQKRFIAYVLCGAFAGLCGLVTAAQAASIPPALGVGQEFIFISAAVLGGVSLYGGKGKIIPGVLLGVLIITTIENGLVLVGANPYSYQIVRGIIIALAVTIDSISYTGELR